MDLRDFQEESNRIEGIRVVKDEEMRALDKLLSSERLRIGELSYFVGLWTAILLQRIMS